MRSCMKQTCARCYVRRGGAGGGGGVEEGEAERPNARGAAMGKCGWVWVVRV